MRKETLTTLALSFIPVVVCIVSNHLVAKKDREQTINQIANGIDINVPEDVVNAAMAKAAANVTAQVANKAVSLVKDDIDKKINESINKAYDEVKGDLEKHLSDQINLTTIDKIENQVVDKAATMIAKNHKYYGYGLTGNSSAGDIVRTCLENGMDAWDTQRILEKASDYSRN
jgi:hypothetical protein